MRPRSLLAALLAPALGCMPPSWGANALLHPARRPLRQRPAGAYEAIDLNGDGVNLKGWRFRAQGAKRGTVVFLHGVGDNRGSSVGIAQHFVARGFDVLAYDSRAHGESGGDACTYGFYEKRDLARALDLLGDDHIVVMGWSMGAAVALQAAAQDARVGVLVAVAPIADLRMAVYERAPAIASRKNVDDALSIAEQQGHFRISEVSPVTVAPKIQAPTLVIHGASDHETPVAHSRQVYQALRQPKQLLIVPGAAHDDPLRPEVWSEVDAWIDQHLPRADAPTVQPSPQVSAVHP
jgi:alpha-beta hydrolase superfamily lysophospholipase